MMPRHATYQDYDHYLPITLQRMKKANIPLVVNRYGSRYPRWGDVRLRDNRHACYKLNELELCYTRWGDRGKNMEWHIRWCPPHVRMREGHRCVMVANGNIIGRSRSAYISGFFSEDRELSSSGTEHWTGRYVKERGVGGYTYRTLIPWLKKHGVAEVALSPMNSDAERFWRHLGYRPPRELPWKPRSPHYSSSYPDEQTWYKKV